MGKNYSKTKNQKSFNPICNVEKMQELRPKLKKLESDNNGRDPKNSSSNSEKKDLLKISEKDRENVLHVRSLLSQNGVMLEYQENKNAIEFKVKGNSEFHYLGITCYGNVLKIYSLGKICGIGNCPNEALKHIMHLNFQIQIGSFCYDPEGNSFTYYLGVPLYEKPKRNFVESLIRHAIKILDYCVPEIISCIVEAKQLRKEDTSLTIY